MRWIAVSVVACACGAPRASVEIARPLPRESTSPHAIRTDAHGDASWARAFPKEKTFESVELPDAAHVVFTWQHGDGRPVAAVTLRVNDRVIALGELPGDAWPMQLTYCKNLGWHFASKSAWGFPNEPSVVSAYSVAIMQGNDDFLVLRDGATFHVLHRQTSDGSCQEAKQGPLDVCKDFEWKRRAEIHAANARDVDELVLEKDAAYDCSVEYYGEKLAPP